MAFTTKDATTRVAAVVLREAILDGFRDVKALIMADTPGGNKEALEKLRRLVAAIEVFMEDRKISKSLFASDKIALEDLQKDVISLISVFEEKSEIARLKEAKSLEKRAKTILTPA